MIFNKWQLNRNYVCFRKIAKYHLTELEIGTKNIYETLAHLQICILAMRSNKTSFLFISRFYLYCSITIWYICDEITTVFWLDNSINHFFNMVHWVLRLNSLTIEENIIVNRSKFIWFFFLRGKLALTSLVARHSNNNTWFFYF